MDTLANFLQPLVLIPAVALVILSTTGRFGQLEGQLRQIDSNMLDVPGELIGHLQGRAALFRNALFSFYVAIAILMVCALTSVFMIWLEVEIMGIALILTGLAVAFMLGGIVALIVEVRLSTELFHFRSQHVLSQRAASSTLNQTET